MPSAKAEYPDNMIELSASVIKEMRSAVRRSGAAGIAEVLRRPKYIYTTGWSGVRNTLHKLFDKVVRLESCRMGGHAYLHLDNSPLEYFPSDHIMYMLIDCKKSPRSTVTPTTVEKTKWAVCTGCGQTVEYYDRKGIILLKSVCPRILSHTGVKLICEAIPLPTHK